MSWWRRDTRRTSRLGGLLSSTVEAVTGRAFVGTLDCFINHHDFSLNAALRCSLCRPSHAGVVSWARPLLVAGAPRV